MSVTRRSAGLFEPADGLPYIGRSPFSQHTYIATGFSGVGLVQGTMAAMELTAGLRGERRQSPFDARRVSLGGVRRIVAENFDVAAHWIGDRFASPGSASPDDVPRGEGRLMKIDGERRAVFREADGKLHILSPVCTHMGCIVHWNKAERSWDCPCHGARYAATGEVLEGPALRGLASDTREHAEEPEEPEPPEQVRPLVWVAHVAASDPGAPGLIATSQATSLIRGSGRGP